jgi:biotin operon repressor
MLKQDHVALLAAKGYTIPEVAAQLCISPNTVRAHAGNLRAKGVTVKFRRRHHYGSALLTRLDSRSDKTHGSVVGLLLGMDEAVATWLLNAVPQGASVADVIRSILVDAFHEEVGE